MHPQLGGILVVVTLTCILPMSMLIKVLGSADSTQVMTQHPQVQLARKHFP